MAIKALYYGTFLVGLILSAIATLWVFSLGMIAAIDGNPFGFMIAFLSPIVFYIGLWVFTLLCLFIHLFSHDQV